MVGSTLDYETDTGEPTTSRSPSPGASTRSTTRARRSHRRRAARRSPRTRSPAMQPAISVDPHRHQGPGRHRVSNELHSHDDQRWSGQRHAHRRARRRHARRRHRRGPARGRRGNRPRDLSVAPGLGDGLVRTTSQTTVRLGRATTFQTEDVEPAARPADVFSGDGGPNSLPAVRRRIPPSTATAATTTSTAAAAATTRWLGRRATYLEGNTGIDTGRLLGPWQPGEGYARRSAKRRRRRRGRQRPGGEVMAAGGAADQGIAAGNTLDGGARAMC